METIIQRATRSIRKRLGEHAITEDMDLAFRDMAAAHPLLRGNDPAQYTTYKAVEYLVKNGIEGDLVECGVAEGRQAIVMALTLKSLGRTERDLYLYDTFAGMTEPTAHDGKLLVDLRKLDVEETRRKWKRLRHRRHNTWCYCPIEQVRENVQSTDYPQERVHLIQGNVLDTIPNDFHQKIALLRLDTDFFDSTLVELENLYDLVTPRGVISIDDYGAWAGCRKAVHDFFEARGLFPLLHRVSWKERVFIKL